MLFLLGLVVGLFPERLLDAQQVQIGVQRGELGVEFECLMCFLLEIDVRVRVRVR